MPPQSTRTSPRTSARFGRSAATPQARRFGRPGAAGTKPRQTARTKPRQTSRTSSAFGRVTGRKPEQKGMAAKVAGLLPTRAASKATPSSKSGKAGGLAALAAAAGVAFRNRDKLTAMLDRRRGRGSEDTEAQTPAPTPPATDHARTTTG